MAGKDILVRCSEAEKQLIQDYCRARVHKMSPWILSVVIEHIIQDKGYKATVEHDIDSNQSKVNVRRRASK